MKKFTISCTTPTDGETSYMTVTNRAGRTWKAVKPEHIDNIGEDMMCLDEWLNSEGGKLDPKGWEEVK